MQRIIISALLLLGLPILGISVPTKTDLLHLEAREHKNPNITQETHPILYGMIKNLITKANTDMPKYITVHGAEQLHVDDGGRVNKSAENMTAWADALGDLHICHEILTDLSYEEAEGLIAIAVMEKANYISPKLWAIGCATFVGTIALIYFLNKQYQLNIGSFIIDHRACEYERRSRMEGIAYLSIAPALLAAKIASNNYQKQVDCQATQLVNIKQITNGIKARVKLENTYIKEGFFSRVANALKLKALCNFIFYPVREYTLEERISYLEQLTI